MDKIGTGVKYKRIIIATGDINLMINLELALIKKTINHPLSMNQTSIRCYKQSPETVEKRRQKLLGVPHTEEHKRKISESLKGHKQTEEHRRNRLESYRRNRRLKSEEV